MMIALVAVLALGGALHASTEVTFALDNAAATDVGIAWPVVGGLGDEVEIDLRHGACTVELLTGLYRLVVPLDGGLRVARDLEVTPTTTRVTIAVPPRVTLRKPEGVSSEALATAWWSQADRIGPPRTNVTLDLGGPEQSWRVPRTSGTLHLDGYHTVRIGRDGSVPKLLPCPELLIRVCTRADVPVEEFRITHENCADHVYCEQPMLRLRSYPQDGRWYLWSPGHQARTVTTAALAAREIRLTRAPRRELRPPQGWPNGTLLRLGDRTGGFFVGTRRLTSTQDPILWDEGVPQAPTTVLETDDRFYVAHDLPHAADTPCHTLKFKCIGFGAELDGAVIMLTANGGYLRTEFRPVAEQPEATITGLPSGRGVLILQAVGTTLLYPFTIEDEDTSVTIDKSSLVRATVLRDAHFTSFSYMLFDSRFSTDEAKHTMVALSEFRLSGWSRQPQHVWVVPGSYHVVSASFADGTIPLLRTVGAKVHSFVADVTSTGQVVRPPQP